MAGLLAYLPVVVLVLGTITLLCVTAKRSPRLTDIAGAFGKIFASMSGNNMSCNMSAWRRTKSPAATSPVAMRSKTKWSLRRVLFWGVVLFLLSYIWTYQRVQDAIAARLVDSGVEEVEVGSLIIPYSAFFQSAYSADVGFSRSKKRIRTAVAIEGHLWSGVDARIDEVGMASIAKITGEKFVFSYLTDVKILRPAINRYMQQLVRGKQVAQYEIETFDNRGPYILVALAINNRDQDVVQVATEIAQGLHTDLTVTHQLKVNQVIIKVVNPEAYLSDKTITVIGRGKAGIY